MGQITLNFEDAMFILNNAEANQDARVIAACTVAFFEINKQPAELDPSTRSIALKLTHMVAAAIYDAPAPDDMEG